MSASRTNNVLKTTEHFRPWVAQNVNILLWLNTLSRALWKVGGKTVDNVRFCGPVVLAKACRTENSEKRKADFSACFRDRDGMCGEGAAFWQNSRNIRQ